MTKNKLNIDELIEEYVPNVTSLISDAVNQKENPQILSNTKDKERL